MVASTASTFSPDGALLAVPDTKGSIQIFDVNTKKVTRKLEKHTDEVRWAEF